MTRVDVLILDSAVVDFRRGEFEFSGLLASRGGLARCKSEQMPDYPQEQYRRWIEQGCATAGGPGNTAPLIARNLEKFRTERFNFAEAVQMGNLFAALYIKAPLHDRYTNIRSYEKMTKPLRSHSATYATFEELMAELS